MSLPSLSRASVGSMYWNRVRTKTTSFFESFLARDVRLVTGGISSIFVIGDSDDRFAETSLNPVTVNGGGNE